MSRARHVMTRLLAPVFLLLLSAAAVAAEEVDFRSTRQEPAASVGEEPLAAGEGEEVAEPAPEASQPESERQVETREQKGGYLGYDFLAHREYGGRAFEYGFLSSSPSGGLFYRKYQRENNFGLEGFFLNEHDYHGDLLLDIGGDYRFHLRTESLFHNLDNERLFPQGFSFFRSDPPRAGEPATATYTPRQLDLGTNYGISVTQDNVDFRYRLHNFPLHLNLNYWRLEREGSMQLRFADTAFEGATNTVYAVPRIVKQRTQEGRLGLDAHLGPVDLIYDFKVRVFEDKAGTPVDNFVSRDGITGALQTVGGLRQHNENPDSSLISNSVKLHTSLAGGLVASGSYSIDHRENLSRLYDTTGAKHITTTMQNAATDLVYTPSQYYSLAVKFRHQELDNDNRGEVLSSNFVNPVQTVKPPVNFEKEIVLAVLSYRPRRDLSLTGEYRGDFLNRNNVSALPTPTTWALPENSATNKGTLALYYRPRTGTRVSADYSYTSTDHPSYGTSFQQRHEGKILATYTRNSTWGGSANVIVRREHNGEVEHFLINGLADPVTFSASEPLSRDKRMENANIAAWVTPFGKLNLGANYAFLQTRVEQGILFTGSAPGSFAASQYLSRSHVYGVSATCPATEKLDLSLLLQQTRSLLSFDPEAVAFSPSSDTSGIRDITRQQTVISLLSARGEYRFTPTLSTMLEYVVRDYDERNPNYSAYNGTVHTVFATVAAKW